jgi:ribosomal protein S6
MSFYEINLLLSSKLSVDEANAEVVKIEATLQSSGKLSGDRKIEMKKLAYPILKHEEAWFTFITLYPEKNIVRKDLLAAIEKQIKENSNIIRSLILKKEEIKIKKSRERVAAAKAERKVEETKPEDAAEEPTKQKVELEEVEEKLNEMLGE